MQKHPPETILQIYKFAECGRVVSFRIGANSHLKTYETKKKRNSALAMIVTELLYSFIHFFCLSSASTDCNQSFFRRKNRFFFSSLRKNERRKWNHFCFSVLKDNGRPVYLPGDNIPFPVNKLSLQECSLLKLGGGQMIQSLL